MGNPRGYPLLVVTDIIVDFILAGIYASKQKTTERPSAVD